MDIIKNQKHRSMNDLANAIACYFELYSSSSPVAMSKFLTEEGFVRRAKANLIAPTYIQGRKFDKIFSLYHLQWHPLWRSRRRFSFLYGMRRGNRGDCKWHLK